MSVMDLIVRRPNGLYCPPGDFYIDPWRPVDQAVITHGHSDHARWGSENYLCHADTVPILRKRLGAVNVRGVAYGETIMRNGVAVSLHPAGHVLGSAQIRVEYRGEVWVASGDYKLEDDGTCVPFEPVRCDAFITECTFGLPIYRWRPQQEIYDDLNHWWAGNAAAGRASVVLAYGLGKAQRVLKHLDDSIGPIICHGAIEAMTDLYREAGVALPKTFVTSDKVAKADLARALVLAPPSASGGVWMNRFGAYSDAFASGWMQVRGARRRRGVDQGFALSDHVDWPGLMKTIEATGASRIFATHGSVAPLVRYLREKGFDAQTIDVEYGDEAEEEALPDEAPPAT